MSNAFAKHGIGHLSASSLNLWRDNLSAWVMRYLANHKDDGNPAMWRGQAVEDGFTALLRGADPAGVAMNTFEQNAVGEASDECEDERKRIPGMLRECAKWQPAAPLIGTQLRMEHWLEGVPVPVVGYIDYVFEDGMILDLKTTKACPSTPKPDHCRQVALYRAARSNSPGSLLYVTDKRHACYPVGDNEAAKALAGLRADALALEAFLSRVDSAKDALHCLPFNDDDFRVNTGMKNAYATLMGA